MYKQITNTACFIRNRVGDIQPETGIILGTGLGGLADRIEAATALDYADIPGFPVSTVEGHRGRLIFGMLGGMRVVAMQGRFHYYEGYPTALATLPVRVMKLLGIKRLFVSNASGGVNPGFRTGDLMIITDHINLIPNPLIGPNIESMGVRFPDMSGAYSRELIALADSVGEKLGIKLQHGCYVGTTGPSLETQAEYRYFRTIGGDTVGMSTTPEVIVANHCSIPVFGVSVVTNMGIAGLRSTHEEIQVEGAKAEKNMTALITGMLESI